MNTQNETVVKVKTIKGTSFVGVRNYENVKGEVSNQTFVVGINYTKLLSDDLDTLSNFDINTIVEKYPNDRLTVLKAYNELLISLVKRTASEEEKDRLRANKDETIGRSDAQIDAYEYITKGLKSKDEILYLTGVSVRKTVLVSVEYPKTKSQLKTTLKREIEKSAKLRSTKYRMFKLGNLETLKIQGVSIKK